MLYYMYYNMYYNMYFNIYFMMYYNVYVNMYFIIYFNIVGWNIAAIMHRLINDQAQGVTAMAEIKIGMELHEQLFVATTSVQINPNLMHVGNTTSAPISFIPVLFGFISAADFY